MIPGAMALTTPLSGSVVTLGTFDGVHLGHQTLLARAVEGASALGLPSVAYTFDPHPAQVLAPAFAPRTLCPLAARIQLLRTHGIDTVLVEPFTPNFSEVSADEWVEKYLVGQLHPKKVVTGFNFTYGKGRGGDNKHLQEAGAAFGFSVEVIPQVECQGVVASSTRIRSFLLEGNLEGAELLLGRPYALMGEVVEGDKRGRRLGFPTANLRLAHTLVPESGVYACSVAVLGANGEEEIRVNAVTNIGHRPTFSGQALSVEAHLLGFDGNLYGRALSVSLVRRLREERRFPGVEALAAQIEKDIAAAEKVFASEPTP